MAAGHRKTIDQPASRAIPSRRRMVRFQNRNFDTGVPVLRDRAGMAVTGIGFRVSTGVPGWISQPMVEDWNCANDTIVAIAGIIIGGIGTRINLAQPILDDSLGDSFASRWNYLPSAERLPKQHPEYSLRNQMKTTISFASAGLAIILASPMTAHASDYGSHGQRVAHRQEQPLEEVAPASNTRPAFENQQRLLQEGQAEAELERSQDNRYQARDDRNYYQYREYREYRDDRQEGRNRRRNQRRYRQYQYRGDWR